MVKFQVCVLGKSSSYEETSKRNDLVIPQRLLLRPVHMKELEYCVSPPSSVPLSTKRLSEGLGNTTQRKRKKLSTNYRPKHKKKQIKNPNNWTKNKPPLINRSGQLSKSEDSCLSCDMRELTLMNTKFFSSAGSLLFCKLCKAEIWKQNRFVVKNKTSKSDWPTFSSWCCFSSAPWILTCSKCLWTFLSLPFGEPYFKSLLQGLSKTTYLSSVSSVWCAMNQ